MSEKRSSAPASEKKKLGVLFTNKDNHFYVALRDGIEAAAAGKYEIVYEQTAFSVEAQCMKLRELAASDISGLIFTPIDNPEVLEHMLPFYEKSVPIITLNSDLPKSNRLAFVGCDNYKNGRASGELLSMITGGRAEIAIITGSRDMIAHEQRIHGFKDYIKEHAPRMSIEDIIECKNDDYTAYDLTNRLLLAYPSLNALYFTAGGVEVACKALEQMTVPRNISVVSFDILDSTKMYLKKGLITASMLQDPIAQGKKAVEVIDDYLTDGKRPEKDEIFFPISVMLKEMA